MIQLQTARLQASNSLLISAKMNTLLDHEEAESGAAACDDQGKQIWC